MVNIFLRPLRICAQVLTSNDTPRQTAWGVTLGMIVGMLPKGNLLAIGAAMLTFSFRVNKLAALLAIGLFSYVGWFFDGLAHRLGALVLTWEGGREYFLAIYQMPLGPFLGFNNTTVLGQLLIGLYLAYPTYALAYAVAVRVQPRLAKWLMSYRVIRWLKGAELGVQWGLER